MSMNDKIKQAHEAENGRMIHAAAEKPHPETMAMAELGLTEWASRLTDEETASVCDPAAGRPVRWIDGVGWSWNE